ncbi:hypothetical protein [Corynebacterium sp.]|uniref:hypothetical protein n=1 Tax=Corynebacterium sp. TaxID=1720 RepID=UPI0026DB27A5|nr:hypothetical protein [Corynebacterium sp.]MDO5032655.1 hypothetical protein [Corynebacterium sp.]
MDRLLKPDKAYVMSAVVGLVVSLVLGGEVALNAEAAELHFASYWGLVPIGLLTSLVHVWVTKRKAVRSESRSCSRDEPVHSLEESGVASVVTAVAVVAAVLVVPALVFGSLSQTASLVGCVVLAAMPLASATLVRA